MRIGVVGDIHGNLTGLKEALREMKKIDLLLFTGDGVREIREISNELAVSITGVKGNCDFVSNYPEKQFFQIEQYKIFLTHGHLYEVKQGLTRIRLAAQEERVNLIIFGHTHERLIDFEKGVNLFNPGALSRERAYQGSSYGMIEINGTEIHMYQQKL